MDLTQTRPEAWERFRKHAAYVRGNPRFDVGERGRSLEVAERVRSLLEAARPGVELGPSLEALQKSLMDRVGIHFLIAPRERGWLDRLAASSDASLRKALAGFLQAGSDAEARFARFVQAAEEGLPGGAVGRHADPLLAIGSLLNFATAPELLPVVRESPFVRLERMLGYDSPAGTSVLDRYRHHVEFARAVHTALRKDRVPARDMIDVQGLIFAFPANPNALWTEDPPSAQPGSGDADGNGGDRRQGEGGAYLSVCACLGYDAPYLLEWLEFHRLVGVERFFLYNNGDRDAQHALLERYVEEGLVVLYDWPLSPPMVPAFNHCLRTHRDDSRWIAFIDTDEFLFSPPGRLLPEVLTEYERWPGVGVNGANFGPSGHREQPAGLVVENYFQRLGRLPIKSIVDPVRTTDCLNPHLFQYANGRAVDENKYPIMGARTRYLSLSRLKINHYYTKSEAEFGAKWTRGRPHAVGSRGEHRLAEYAMSTLARFGQTDREILRYVPALRERVAARRSPVGRSG